VFQVRYSPCFVHTDNYTPYKDKKYFSFIVKFSFISRTSVLIPLFITLINITHLYVKYNTALLKSHRHCVCCGLLYNNRQASGKSNAFLLRNVIGQVVTSGVFNATFLKINNILIILVSFKYVSHISGGNPSFSS